jgi:CheY-like chemotaxis protein
MVNNCHWIQKLENFDKSKESILIIDDNEGVVSFIKDDLEVVFQERGMSLDSYNILEFSSGMAAYHFIATSQFYGGLNITKAISIFVMFHIIMLVLLMRKKNGLMKNVYAFGFVSKIQKQ